MSNKPIGGKLRRKKRLRKKYWKHIKVYDSGTVILTSPLTLVYVNIIL